MRLIKDDHELSADARRRPTISSAAHRPRDGRDAARAGTNTRSRPNCCTNSCATARRPSPIRRSWRRGPNACVLHYRDNDRRDGGRRSAADRRRLRIPRLRVGHHAHVSRERQVQRAAEGRPTSSCSRRSWPASTRCSRAPNSTTTTRRPSACWPRASSISACARARSTRCWRTAAYKQFYMHRAGHWLGMDVHDAGPLPGEGRVADAGARAWCSPSSSGRYIRPADNVPEHFWNIGVRIEDDVLVTAKRPREPDRGRAQDRCRRRSGLPAVASEPRRMHDVVIVGAGPVGGAPGAGIGGR